MQKQQHFAAVVLLAAALPMAAFADLSGTPTLSGGTALNLDTGATASSGGDLLWSGSAITPQTNATAYNFGAVGATTFNVLTQATLTGLAGGLSKSAIPVASLSVGTVLVVHTNGGNYAKVLVTAQSGSSISLQFTTFGASGAPDVPSFTAIQNNYSYIQSGMPNYGIAPGALFIIKGTGLADPNAAAVLQSSAAPGIPKTLNGASVSVTVNGVTTTPGIYYAVATQLGVVLPAATPVGTGTLTVTYNNTPSQPVAIVVVASALGIGTYNGLAIATDYTTYALYTPTRSAKPGDIIILWGSGVGAIPSDSDTVYTAAPHAYTGSPQVQVYIGGILANVGYQGDSGYPGVNQIAVTVPLNVLPGCSVSLVAVSGAITSNSTAIPVAANGGACSDPAYGITGAQSSTLSGQSTVKTGAVILLHSVTPTGTSDIAESSFQSTTGSNYASSSSIASLGSCVVSQTVTGTVSTTTNTGLDAGIVTVTGPAGSATLAAIQGVAGISLAQLATGFIPTTGGSFTFRGAGGANVGSFNVTLTFPNPVLAWTNTAANATINRPNGTSITWSGGAPNSYVVISGTSSGSTVSGSYTCYAPVAAGQFTVPAPVLLSLPPGSGTTTVENATNFQSFSASGIDSGFAFGGVSQEINSTYN